MVCDKKKNGSSEKIRRYVWVYVWEKTKRGRRGEERIELPNQVGVFYFILSIFFFKKKLLV